MRVIMVAHGHILENMDKLADKIILDTRKITEKRDGVYYIQRAVLIVEQIEKYGGRL